MSYQSFLQSTANSVAKTPSPGSIHRKPPGAPNPSAAPSVASLYTNRTRITTPSSATNQPHTPASSTSSPVKPLAPVIPPPEPIVTPAATGEPVRTTLAPGHIDAAVKACLELQRAATSLHSKRPFAALLLGPDNTTVLLTHTQISHVQHAEAELARLASVHFSAKYLAACTLVSTWEPCAMCTGTLYWSNIGRLVYAASEASLKELTGRNNSENMTMALPCRDVLRAGQKDVEVLGPLGDWEERVVEESGRWWREHGGPEPEGRPRVGSVNGSSKPGSLSSVSMRQTTPTTWTGEDTVLSRIDDEGEYKAELDIDWMR